MNDAERGRDGRPLEMKARSHRWLHSGAPGRWALVILLVLGLSVAGYLLTAHAVNDERRATARANAGSQAQQARTMLARAGAFATGLSSALAAEPAPSARRFEALVGSSATTVGLAEAMWVERITARQRRNYERRIGGAIATPPGSRPAASGTAYLPATFVTGLPFHPGTDVAGLPALAEVLANPTAVFAGSATRQEAIAGQPGFFLVQGAQFGHGTGSQGFLVVFVPAGWLASNGTPGSSTVSLDGRRLVGTLGRSPAASESFQALTNQWSVQVSEPAATEVQTLLPRLALAWPAAVALLVLLITRGVQRRRRAEREVDDVFDLSLDPLCVLGTDGYVKRVNPAFEQTLGFDENALRAHRVRELAHPDDRAEVGASIDSLRAGNPSELFEARFLRADGDVRWLMWSMRPVLERGRIYGAAHDITSARSLLQEQAALRRVATLVAKGAGAEELFSAVALEVGELLGADATRLLRYEEDGTTSVVAAHGASDAVLGIHAGEGSEEGDVWRALANAAASAGHAGNGSSSHARGAWAPAIVRALAAPIAVSGHDWGEIVVAWTRDSPTEPAAESRLGQFTELVATAVADAESRTALAESRRRVVTAGDEARRRIERDLHDGAQQRLVHAVVALKLARRKLEEGSAGAAELVEQALETAEDANQELRELAHGIHPAVLSRGGLAPALQSLAERSPIPVSLEVKLEGRLPQNAEVTAYFLVSEALVNAAKHSRASSVDVSVQQVDGRVRLSIDDDGVGGADPTRGSGLVGLKDRVEAVGGTLSVRSPSGKGTHLTAELPVGAR